MDAMTLHEAIYTQRAIRRFTDAPVGEEDVAALLDAAVRAPSGGNRQPWHFVVLRDPARKAVVRGFYLRAWNAYKEKVAEQARTLPEAAAAVKRWEKDPSGDLFAQNLDKVPVLILPCIDMKVLDFGGDPDVPSVMEMNSIYASIYPAVQNLLLTARARGLGAVLTTLHCVYEDEVKRALGIPAHVRTTCMIPVGHPAAPYGPTRRVPAAERVHLDGWRREKGAEYATGRGDMRVADRMSRDPVTCSPDDRVYDVQKRMQKERIRQLPVLEGGRLVGIITDRDVRDTLLPADVPERLKERFDLLLVRRVRDAMTREPITVSPGATLERAAELIRSHKIGALPVLDGPWLAGLISDGDVLRGMMDAIGQRKNSVRFSIAVGRGSGGVSSLLKELEEHGIELLSVVSGPDPADPEGKVNYLIRVWKGDPAWITDFLKEKGVSPSDVMVEGAED